MNTRLDKFGSSVFAEMTALAKKFGAVNLGQGFPDFDTPEEIKEIAIKAIRDGHNQYAISHGEQILREAIAQHAQRFYGMSLDANTEVCVTSGASEALWCACTALLQPGDEVIVFEPCFDVYLPDIAMAGAVAVPVQLHAPEFRFDADELQRAITHKTRMILCNSPHNPTGTVFTRGELELIRDICVKHNLYCVSDEVYEHIVFDDAKHIPIATIDGMEHRTITISSGGKTFSSTGWKCGWAIGSKPLIDAVRRVHQFTVFAGATPFHYAIAHALSLPDSFYAKLQQEYQQRRDFLTQCLKQTPLQVYSTHGSYFVTVNVAPLGFANGVDFCKHLIEHIGVAAIPSQKFYVDELRGLPYVRFCFCKTDATLQEASRRLLNLH